MDRMDTRSGLRGIKAIHKTMTYKRKKKQRNSKGYAMRIKEAVEAGSTISEKAKVVEFILYE